MFVEEELIQQRLIEGMYNNSQRCKMLGQLQLSKMPLNSCVNFIQLHELIKKI